MPTFDTPTLISASIDLAVGDVRITAGDCNTTTVDVTPSDASNDHDRKAAEQTRVEFANDQLRIKAPKLGSWLSKRGGSIDVTIGLPTGSHLDGKIGVGDFQCEGHLGDCRIKSGVGHIRLDHADTSHLSIGAGDITMDHVTGRTEVTSGTGKVRVRELDQGAVIKNANGDTWVGTAGGDLRLNSANGDIAVDRAHASVVAKSAHGDVRLGEVVRGTVVLETNIGDLEVGVREGTAAWLDVNSRLGRVSTSLDAADTPDASAETVEIRARTSVGEVVIRRS